jgi:hypothetical protein
MHRDPNYSQDDRPQVHYSLQILPAVILLAVLIGGSWIAWRILQPYIGPTTARAIPTATVIHQVQSLSQLVTVRYVMEKVVILEDVKWYGESRVLLIAHGVVKAGVDLSQIKPEDVRIEGQKIRIRLPRAALTDSYLDESKTKIVERTTGLLRTFDKNLEQNAREMAVNDIRRAAREAGILREAEERAQLQLRVFLHQTGYQQIDFD